MLDKDRIGDVVRRVCGGSSSGGREVERVVVDGSGKSFPPLYMRRWDCSNGYCVL